MHTHYHGSNDPAYIEPPLIERRADYVLRQYGAAETAKVDRLRVLIERFVDDVTALDIEFWSPEHHDIEDMLDVCRECKPGDRRDVDAAIEARVYSRMK
jgi:hypothetical protein